MIALPLAALLLCCAIAPGPVLARRPIRNAFFNVYPSAVGSRLDNLPSNTNHCGVCHFDFDGGGARNPYGVAVGVARNSGLYADDEAAILSLDGEDSDNDAFPNGIEITDTAGFDNTPTFPGLKASNVGNVLNVDLADIQDYLTPSGATDTTPPTVTVGSPNGGEGFGAMTTQTVTWTATDDASGVARIDLYLSDDGGATYAPVAKGLANSGSYEWFVTNLPGTTNLLRVVATDVAGNPGQDESDAVFTIDPLTYGVVPTTLRDFKLAGTQPLESGILEDPAETCVQCHGNYDSAVEPWHNWRGSMMAHAARDPVWAANMAIVEQEAPSAGDLCIRCHSPGGWQEGRSTDTSGAMLTAKDRQSVQCDFCHRLVDPHYVEGVSPAADEPILAALAAIPLAPANGQFVTDPDPVKRGPYADAVASHQFLESPFHREAALCGTCHDVSNPVFVAGTGAGTYDVQALDTEHPDGDLRNMFPIERTYSEWSVSEYATSGVYAPEFAGNKPDGIVAICQDCHMQDVSGIGCNQAGVPTREDLPLHDLTGGNYFVPDILAGFYPDEVDQTQLDDGKQRALGMLALAATLEVTSGSSGGLPSITVRVKNETGHKLPSGYPEGRRIWLNVKAFDVSDQLVYESGAYDPATGVLTHDEDLQIYHAEPGISTRLAAATGLEAGPSLHFALNDSIIFDNRIPPRGFSNATFAAVQAAPVGVSYADGEYWDDTEYVLPSSAAQVTVTLYYQSTSKEFIDYLRDNNPTNPVGQELHDAWVAQGRAAPVVMATTTVALDLTAVGDGQDTGTSGSPVRVTRLEPNAPNPFNPSTRITYSIARKGPVGVAIYDLRGMLVRVLVEEVQEPGRYEVSWDGRDQAGRPVQSGVYLQTLRADGRTQWRKLTIVK
jgi:hypothetical protein